MLLISGGLTNIQSVMANEIGFTYLGGASPLQATVQGADIVILATAYGLMPYGMVSGKNIHAPADLKGKIFVVARLGGIEETAARIALDRLGVGARNVSFCRRDRRPCASPRWNPARRKRRCWRRRDSWPRPGAVSICWPISAR